jgi:hypothetical protein
LFKATASGLQSLPSGLKVGSIDMTGCLAWDGLSPDDIIIGGDTIHTNAHPSGIRLGA